jgi:PPP family 3-phenylpropionic acid transporter
MKRFSLDNSKLSQYFRSRRGAPVGMWLANFIYWGALANVLPYMGILFESVGLKGGQIGQLNSIPFFVSLVSSILFAFISDRLRKHRLIQVICASGLIATLAIFPQLRSFMAFVPLVFFFSIFNAPANPILIQTTLSALEDPDDFGKVRVGGSIGWGLMVLLSGYLVDRMGLPFLFTVAIALLLLYLFLVIFLPEPTVEEGTETKPVALKDLWEMLRLPGFLIFLLVIIIWGIGEASIQNFLFLHIKDLGGSSTLMGISLSISLVGEIMVFSNSDRIQRRFGPIGMILLAYCVLITWTGGLWLIRNPAVIPFFQVFGGAGFALLLSGSVAFVNQRAPKGLGTTAQAIRGGLYSGLGVGVGAILSGIMYEAFGSAIMYRNMALLGTTGLLFALVVLPRRREKP